VSPFIRGERCRARAASPFVAGTGRAGYFTMLREFGGLHGCVMRPFDTRDVDYRAPGERRRSPPQGLRPGSGYVDRALVRAGRVVVADVLGDDALEVPVVRNENVVKAFATTLEFGVPSLGPRSSIGGRAHNARSVNSPPTPLVDAALANHALLAEIRGLPSSDDSESCSSAFHTGTADCVSDVQPLAKPAVIELPSSRLGRQGQALIDLSGRNGPVPSRPVPLREICFSINTCKNAK
jgi:hypothetical protein